MYVLSQGGSGTYQLRLGWRKKERANTLGIEGEEEKTTI